MVARIEPTIESRLCKEVNLRSKLGVEKQCQTRVEEIVDFAVDESRRRLLEMITYKVNCAAQFGPKIILKRRERERAVEPIKKIFDLQCASAAGEEKEAERSQQPHINLTCSVRRRLRHGKAHLKLSPIVLRTRQSDITTV